MELLILYGVISIKKINYSIILYFIYAYNSEFTRLVKKINI